MSGNTSRSSAWLQELETSMSSLMLPITEPGEGIFGFPAPVIATIISFAAHPEEPEFQTLRNLNPTVRKTVDKFPAFYSKDRILIVETKCDRYKDLSGTWYFTSFSIQQPFVTPNGFGASRANVELCIGAKRIYGFSRDSRDLFLTTSWTDMDPHYLARGEYDKVIGTGKSYFIDLSMRMPEKIKDNHPLSADEMDAKLQKRGHVANANSKMPFRYNQQYVAQNDEDHAQPCPYHEAARAGLLTKRQHLTAVTMHARGIIEQLAKLNPGYCSELFSSLPESQLVEECIRHDELRKELVSIADSLVEADRARRVHERLLIKIARPGHDAVEL